MSIELYPSVAKIKRNGVFENLPGFVPETGSVATQQMIATSESSATAQYVHNKGEYFRLNDTLYQAIVKINVGDAIVVGTNCEVAVLGNDVSHLANSIAEYELGIATNPHSTGEYFMVGETLYVATDDIDVGDSISTSSNCRLAVVGDELSGLHEAIEQTDKVFDTVATMISDITLDVGNNVKTNGYNTVYDGGGAYYKISDSSDRACSIQLANNLYAVLIGNSHTTRQLGIVANEKAQDKINAYIADTSFIALTVLDPIVLKKSASGQAVDVIELIKIRRNNFTLAFEGDGKFTLETLGEDYYRMIAIAANNITVVNPILVGDADTIGITTGEYGHGLYIRTGENITVYNGNIGKCFGDAVCISKDTVNVTFIGTLYCYECGRQGMSVGGCNSLSVDTIIGKNIRRTAPGAVIDFEPNSNTDSIKASVNTIQSTDCTIALCVSGKGNKTIDVNNVISEHTDDNYNADIVVVGAANFNEDPSVYIHVNSVSITNSKRNFINVSNINENLSFIIEDMAVNGVVKTTSNSVQEASILINPAYATIIKNIIFKNIRVINNTSTVQSYGIFLYSNSNTDVTLKDCFIKYTDDSESRVTNTLRYAKLNNTTIVQQRTSDGLYMFNSDIDEYIMDKNTNFRVEGKTNHALITSLGIAAFNLYKLFVDDYTINTASYITEATTYWTITGTKICAIHFDHTNKTITVEKIA